MLSKSSNRSAHAAMARAYMARYAYSLIGGPSAGTENKIRNLNDRLLFVERAFLEMDTNSSWKHVSMIDFSRYIESLITVVAHLRSFLGT